MNVLFKKLKYDLTIFSNNVKIGMLFIHRLNLIINHFFNRYLISGSLTLKSIY